MPSIVWGRDPQEAFENPYEYGIQEQFSREARILLHKLYRLLNSESHRYSGDDRSAEVAIWLLQVDALDSLLDALDALDSKHHRVASKLFRTVLEALDIAALFHARSPNSTGLLERWFNDEFVPHRSYRAHLMATEGAEAAEERKRYYESFSRFLHRTYHAILDGYSSGVGNRLVHDRIGLTYGDSPQDDTLLVLPQTLASYYAALASLIQLFAQEVHERGCLTADEVVQAVRESLEVETVPRRFMPLGHWRRLPPDQS